MQEEMGQFKRNEVWDLVTRPKDVNINGTIEYELWYTHDSTSNLMDCYDVGEEYIATGNSFSQQVWIKKSDERLWCLTGWYII